MKHVFIAKLAIFLHLHAVRMVPLVLIGRIVTLFTVSTCQRNDYPHDHTPLVDNLLNKEPPIV